MIGNLPLRIAIAASVLVLALVALLVRESVARDQGREVVLPMEAFDPRSLLSGHYAALQLAHALPPDHECPSTDGQGWIAIGPTPQGDRVVGAAQTRAAAEKLGPVVVRGKAFCRSAFVADDHPEAQAVVLEIGVTRFHADQDEARAIEKSLAGRQAGPPQAFAIVSAGRDGRARLKGLVIDGRRTELTWF